jgi:hypothetical protein
VEEKISPGLSWVTMAANQQKKQSTSEASPEDLRPQGSFAAGN